MDRITKIEFKSGYDIMYSTGEVQFSKEYTKQPVLEYELDFIFKEVTKDFDISSPEYSSYVIGAFLIHHKSGFVDEIPYLEFLIS